MSAWVIKSVCPVPWCTRLGQASRPTTARALQGLCEPCGHMVRVNGARCGLAIARLRHDRRRPGRTVDLGACDACGAKATTSDADGGAWCKGCAATVAA